MSEAMLDRLEMMQARMLDKGFGAILGPKLVDLDEGYCRMALPWREELSRGEESVSLTAPATGLSIKIPRRSCFASKMPR